MPTTFEALRGILEDLCSQIVYIVVWKFEKTPRTICPMTIFCPDEMKICTSRAKGHA